jgi:uncharacterized membrane protein
MLPGVILLAGLDGWHLPLAANTSSGFGLATVIMIGMILALIYVLVTSIRMGGGAEVSAGPAWMFALIPILAVLGIGVAAYLTFVETQNVAAVCGPVGDCNAVQSSPYAKLFGMLPVGILGLLGYVGIIGAWLVARYASDGVADVARLAIFGMALFGVLFTIYLTYLELFVIHAVCIWCLSSAVLITLLMICSLGPALSSFSVADDDEEEPAAA